MIQDHAGKVNFERVFFNVQKLVFSCNFDLNYSHFTAGVEEIPMQGQLEFSFKSFSFMLLQLCYKAITKHL